MRIYNRPSATARNCDSGMLVWASPHCTMNVKPAWLFLKQKGYYESQRSRNAAETDGFVSANPNDASGIQNGLTTVVSWPNNDLPVCDTLLDEATKSIKISQCTTSITIKYTTTSIRSSIRSPPCPVAQWPAHCHNNQSRKVRDVIINVIYRIKSLLSQLWTATHSICSSCRD